MAFTGVLLFIQEHRKADKPYFDFFGYLTLAVGIGALQLFLDRGATQDWLNSAEVIAEGVIAVLAFYLFVVQMMTAKRPFVDRTLFADGNFVTATVFGFFIGILLFSSLSLLPPMMENLLGYPVVTTGIVSVPRGLGSFISMFLAGQLVSRFDTRIILFVGLVISGVSYWMMSHFSLQMTSAPIMITGFMQGLGTGLIFTPLSTLAFASLSPAFRTEAAGLFTLVRNIGSSVGISIMQVILTNNTQKVHAQLVEHVRPDNPKFQHLGPAFDIHTLSGLEALNGFVTKQASMVAYIDDFKLMMWITVVSVPLLILMRPPKRTAAKPDPAHAAFE